MSKIATIEIISEVSPHPNAERLDLVKVLGYQCVTQRGMYKPGDIIVYVQPDSILPQDIWAEEYRKYSPKRVKAVKLRGEWSEGIIIRPEAIQKQLCNMNFRFNSRTFIWCGSASSKI